MQQATLLNIKAYKSLKYKNFSLKETQQEHELLTDQMISLWTPSMQEFSYLYDERIWEKGREGLLKIYRIQPAIETPIHFIWIDLDKPIYEATRLKRSQSSENIFTAGFVKMNIFNVEFMEAK